MLQVGCRCFGSRAFGEDFAFLKVSSFVVAGFQKKRCSACGLLGNYELASECAHLPSCAQESFCGHLANWTLVCVGVGVNACCQSN